MWRLQTRCCLTLGSVVLKKDGAIVEYSLLCEFHFAIRALREGSSTLADHNRNNRQF